MLETKLSGYGEYLQTVSQTEKSMGRMGKRQPIEICRLLPELRKTGFGNAKPKTANLLVTQVQQKRIHAMKKT